MAGVASLFTREFFEAARARLRPGGLLCQWAHTYEMDEADLASIVATFAAVFPRVRCGCRAKAIFCSSESWTGTSNRAWRSLQIARASGRFRPCG